jgi:hypothetical protein
MPAYVELQLLDIVGLSLPMLGLGSPNLLTSNLGFILVRGSIASFLRILS